MNQQQPRYSGVAFSTARVQAARAKARPEPRSSKPWPLIILAVAALGCVGMGVVWLLSGPPRVEEWRPDLRYLPDQCEIVATVRFDELLSSAVTRSIFDELSQMGENTAGKFAPVSPTIGYTPPAVAVDVREQMNQDVRRQLGLEPSNIMHITVAYADAGRQMVLVVRTRQNVAPDEMLQQWAKHGFRSVASNDQGKPNPFQVGDQSIHAAPGNSAFAVPEERVVVYGPTDVLRTIFERNGDAKLTPEMTEALGQVDDRKTVALAMAFTNVKTSDIGLKWLSSINVPKNCAVELEFGQEIKATLKANFHEKTDAAKAKSAVESGLASIKNGPASMAKTLGNIRFYEAPNQLTITTTINAEFFSGVARMGLPNMPVKVLRGRPNH